MNFPAYFADPARRGRQDGVIRTMRKTSLVMLTVMLAVMLSGAFPGSAVADTDRAHYIRLYGIEGESAFVRNRGCIDVINYSHSTLDPDPQDPPHTFPSTLFTFTHLVDKATRGIQDAWMKGTPMPSATFYACRTVNGKEEVLYTITLTDVKITNAKIDVDPLPGGSFQLVETVQLTAKKFKLEPGPPLTGDSAPLMLWVTLTAVPCVTVCGLLLKRRKRRS